MITYNTSKHSTTKRTPFFINKGFKADILLKTRRYEELIPHTIIIVNKIHELQEKLRQNLIFFNRKIKKFTDRKRVRGPTLRKKKNIYLLRKTPNTKITFI